MLDPFPNNVATDIPLLPLWRDPVLLPAPEEIETVITPNRLATVFRAIKKKNRKKNKRARKSRAKNR